jgi:hypothetical protein
MIPLGEQQRGRGAAEGSHAEGVSFGRRTVPPWRAVTLNGGYVSPNGIDGQVHYARNALPVRRPARATAPARS